MTRSIGGPAHNGLVGGRIVADVHVATATAIVTRPDSRYQILVGESVTHQLPVLPGGKLERHEGVAGTGSPGLACVLREVLEEVSVELQEPRYIGKATDPLRDIRIVPASRLATALTIPPLEELGLSGDESPQVEVRAHYGTPDYIYVGIVDGDAVRAATDLRSAWFLDVRELRIGDLSAGHDVIALRYREMLEKGTLALPSEALGDFGADAAHLRRLYGG